MALTKVSYSMINGALVNVLDYGADLTGSSDSTEAIQDALDTGKLVYLPEGTYKITDTLTITSGGICGDGPTSILKRYFTGGALLEYPEGGPIQITSFSIDCDSSVTVVDGDSGIEIGYGGGDGWTGGGGEVSNIIIQKQWDGFAWKGGSFNLIDNIICRNNKGDGFSSVNGRGPITNCLSILNYGNGFYYYNEVGTATNSGLTMISCGTFANQGFGYAFTGTNGEIGANIWMESCVASTDGEGGIRFFQPYWQVWIGQQLIESCGDAYIYNSDFTQYNNAVGFQTYSGCKRFFISDMFVQTCQGSGLIIDGLQWGQFSNLTIDNNGLGQQSGYQYGILLNSNDSQIQIDNLMANNGPYQTTDVSIGGTGMGDIQFTCSNFRTYENFSSASSIVFSNCITSATTTVASAASLGLPDYTNFINVTGTTNITSIATPATTNRQITLKFNDVLTVVDGNNLKLASSFTTSADDTLTLISNGTNWYEVSRSAN